MTGSKQGCSRLRIGSEQGRARVATSGKEYWRGRFDTGTYVETTLSSLLKHHLFY